MSAALVIALGYGAAMTVLFVIVLLGHRELLDRHTEAIRNEIAADYAREWDDLAAEDQALFIVADGPRETPIHDDLAVEVFRRALDTLDETQDYR